MEDLDTTLATLKKHGVTEFSQDQFGIRVKFKPENSPGFDAIMREMSAGPVAEAKPELDEGPVDTQRVDVEAALWGAK